MKTYKTFGAAVNDPGSSIAQWLKANEPKKQRNATAIDALMAQGMTREQAWTHALRMGR